MLVLNADFKEFIELLNDDEVEYLVVGGYAVGYHGRPRYTGDIDFWIAVSSENARKVLQVLHDFGFWSLKKTFATRTSSPASTARSNCSMTEAVKKWLFYIQTSTESYLGPRRNFNEYLSNQMLRGAVKREFKIIGEAVNRIRKSGEPIATAHASKIVALRNQIIHGYTAFPTRSCGGLSAKICLRCEKKSTPC